ncbi:hypothetical protein ACFUN7_06545 [Streptomyces sp. NPDC057236]|uniref:hypothetical protein n=1 Tax=Streptomyces sp. NPDC057236 TaxID=3346059 RepID=UPI003626A69C
MDAEWGEHTGTRTTWRNGHREKTVNTDRRPGTRPPGTAGRKLLPQPAGTQATHRQLVATTEIPANQWGRRAEKVCHAAGRR